LPSHVGAYPIALCDFTTWHGVFILKKDLKYFVFPTEINNAVVCVSGGKRKNGKGYSENIVHESHAIRRTFSQFGKDAGIFRKENKIKED